MHQNPTIHQVTLLCAASFTMYVMMTSPASAAMASVICSIYSFVRGTIGPAVATMGVLAVAVGASIGKVSWGLAVTTAIGITIIFQAAWYAQFFISGGNPCGI